MAYHKISDGMAQLFNEGSNCSISGFTVQTQQARQLEIAKSVYADVRFQTTASDRTQLFIVIGFLAGFSERFTQQILKLYFLPLDDRCVLFVTTPQVDEITAH